MIYGSDVGERKDMRQALELLGRLGGKAEAAKLWKGARVPRWRSQLSHGPEWEPEMWTPGSLASGPLSPVHSPVFPLLFLHNSLHPVMQSCPISGLVPCH